MHTTTTPNVEFGFCPECKRTHRTSRKWCPEHPKQILDKPAFSATNNHDSYVVAINRAADELIEDVCTFLDTAIWGQADSDSIDHLHASLDILADLARIGLANGAFKPPVSDRDLPNHVKTAPQWARGAAGFKKSV